MVDYKQLESMYLECVVGSGSPSAIWLPRPTCPACRCECQSAMELQEHCAAEHGGSVDVLDHDGGILIRQKVKE